MKRAIAIFCTLLLCLLSAALLPIRAEDTGAKNEKIEKVENPPASVNLEYKFKVGEMRRYNMTIDASGVFALPKGTNETEFETHTWLTVIQHATAYLPKEDVWKLELDVLSATLSIPNFGETLMTFPPLDLEVDKYGQVRKIKGIEELKTSGLPKDRTIENILSQLKFLGLPQKELHVGDTWEQEYPIEALDQSVTVKTVSKLVGFERVDGVDCAKIESTFEVPFKFEMKKSENSEAKSSSTKEAPKRFLVGTEKGEHVTHFAYEEGKVMRAQATITLIADIKSEGNESDKNNSTSALNNEGSADERHDLNIKYVLVSKFDPELPINLEEKE
ncbi:MAG: hypothetical protein QHH26_09105 [Armatimonadota bacterium]|nr:hypothetical protein [Armatimonadota bacterium]